MDRKKLARALRERGLSISAIAKALEVSESTVRRWLKEFEPPRQAVAKDSCLERLDRIERLLAEVLKRLDRLPEERPPADVKPAETGGQVPTSIAENAWVKFLKSKG
ncbi:MAG: helix-turn-helix domain-containing protein [Thermoproteus sp.]